jgi:hypothetical protein
MNGIAALAAKEAFVASGLGTTLLPGIAPSAVDGFAVGTLLSGICFLLVMAPRRHPRKNRLSARGGKRGGAASVSAVPEYAASEWAASVSAVPEYAASEWAAPESAARAYTAPESAARAYAAPESAARAYTAPGSGAPRYSKYSPAEYAAPAVRRCYPATSMADPFADESAEVLVPAAGLLPDGMSRLADGTNNGYDSKRRQAAPDTVNRRPETRRSAGRHAAPSASIASKMASRFASHPIPVRN